MRAHYNIFYWSMIIILFSLSFFFTYRIISFKLSLTLASGSLSVKSGTEVEFVKAIDGDEIAVKTENQNFIVRILGIKSFDPTVNDPYVAGITQQGLSFLIKQFAGKKLTLRFIEFKLDDKNRLLSYIECGGKDIGLEMIKNGMALVYIRYPFERMAFYLVEEKKARVAKKGLWGNKVTTERAKKLKIIWEQERSDV